MAIEWVSLIVPQGLLAVTVTVLGPATLHVMLVVWLMPPEALVGDWSEAAQVYVMGVLVPAGLVVALKV